MVGNAWEFVQELVTPSAQAMANFGKLITPPPGADEPWYTIRGQGFNDKELADSAIWDSGTVPARFKGPNIGFRCVKDPQ